MTLIAFILVLVSVFLHAGWNFLSKKSNPSAAFYTISSTVAATIWLFFFLFGSIDFAALPARFWSFLLTSIGCEAIYCFSLAYAYQTTDISLAYPLGRSLPVLMVTAVTMIFGLGTMPSPLALGGMILIVLGCLLLPPKNFRDFSWKTYLNRSIYFILLIAIGTTGYTILDSQALGILRAHDSSPKIIQALSYLFFIETGIALSLGLIVVIFKKEREEFKRLAFRSWAPVATGVISSGAYGLILIAMKYVTNVSYIQAFRQMSLPLGVLAGVFILKESCPKTKICGMILIVIGLIFAAF